MIVTCPECGARYKLPDDAIPDAGRRMRCAECDHAWLATRDAASAAPEPPPIADAEPPPPRATRLVAPEPAPEPFGAPDVHSPADDLEPDAPRPRTIVKTLVAIVLGLAFTAAAVAIQLRQLPPGLPRLPWLERPMSAPPRPVVSLTLSFTHADRALPSGKRLLELSGEVANPTATPQPVPAIEASLADPAGAALYRWTIAPPIATLPPGRAIAFASTAFDPPAAARAVSLRFAP